MGVITVKDLRKDFIAAKRKGFLKREYLTWSAAQNIK